MAKYILFDTETTGNQESDRIIQIGGMIIHEQEELQTGNNDFDLGLFGYIEPKEEIEVYDDLCFTEVPISVEAMEVHNITPDLIVGKFPFIQTDFYKKLQTYNLPENYLIAHNIGFDLGMLQKEGFENHYTLIDTFRCAKHLLPQMPYHRLQYLRYALDLYKIEQEEAQKLHIVIKAHDAIGDVLVMKLLLGKLVEIVKSNYPDIDPMEKLSQLTQTPVMMRTFKFGKYKERLIEEIAHEDPGYLTWMRNNLELDEDMKFTLDNYLH
ncbi:MAG: 3'-5' exonuclease [Campylobacterales bacterium]|nr:3'-5' exonuclease [Campylobacterales bacterium]